MDDFTSSGVKLVSDTLMRVFNFLHSYPIKQISLETLGSSKNKTTEGGGGEFYSGLPFKNLSLIIQFRHKNLFTHVNVPIHISDLNPTPSFPRGRYFGVVYQRTFPLIR